MRMSAGFSAIIAIAIASTLSLTSAMAADPPAAAMLAAATAPAARFDAEKYFSGKTIRIIVGFRAGGGTDIQTRYFAAHWSDFLPGHPRFTVTNLNSYTAAMNLLSASQPDGFTLELSPGSGISQQFTDRQAKYDVAKFRVIGTHTPSDSIILASESYPYKTIRDAIDGKTVLKVGAQSPDDGYVMRIAAMSHWLNIPVKFISGLNGTAPNLIALERGDTNGYLAGGGGGAWYELPFIRPGWFKAGTLRAWADLGPSDIKIGPNAELPAPDLPKIVDLIKDTRDKEIYEIFAQADSKYGKVFMAPPGTPDDVVDALRKSYEALLADKGVREPLEKLMGEPVSITGGEAVEKDLARIVADYRKNDKAFDEWVVWARERF
jgi:tripartite-type tricarboxylate transporter receptor subunit TctC